MILLLRNIGIVFSKKGNYNFANRYLNRKRRIAGWLLVPWKVSTNQKSNYDSNVPINATLISTINIAVNFFFIIWQYLFENSIVPAFVALTTSMIQIPIVIAFTISHQNRISKIDPIVPSTLQFHGDDNDFEENKEERKGDVKEMALKTLVENLACPKTPELDCDDDQNIEHTFQGRFVNDQIDNYDEIEKLPGQVCHM